MAGDGGWKGDTAGMIEQILNDVGTVIRVMMWYGIPSTGDLFYNYVCERGWNNNGHDNIVFYSFTNSHIPYETVQITRNYTQWKRREIVIDVI